MKCNIKKHKKGNTIYFNIKNEMQYKKHKNGMQYPI